MPIHKIRGREVLNTHGACGRARWLEIEHAAGEWRERSSRELITAYRDGAAEYGPAAGVVILSENPRRAPFLPQPGEVERIGMPVHG